MVGEDGEGRGHVKEGREGLGEDLGFHSKSGCCWELSREPCIDLWMQGSLWMLGRQRSAEHGVREGVGRPGARLLQSPR